VSVESVKFGVGWEWGRVDSPIAPVCYHCCSVMSCTL